MIGYQGALDALLRAVASRAPLGTETISIDDSHGRVAAAPIIGAAPIPAFDNSAMDGFALACAAISGAAPGRPALLPVIGSSSVGDFPRKGLRSLSGPARGAWEIMTGAPIPPGCDAVVKVEDARVLDGGKAVEILSDAQPGDYVRRAGSDFRKGATAVEPGTWLDERHLLALTALGVEEVPVRRRPKVAFISTGRELAMSGRKPRPGQIRNVSAFYLRRVLPRLGAEPRFHGNSPDDPKDFATRLARALAEGPDVVVTTGAVSKGKCDFVAESVKKAGAGTLFHSAAVRPAKPLLAALFPGGPLFLGLPGNPVSTIVGLRFFLVPVLRSLLGLPPESAAFMRLAADVRKPEGFRCFFKARVSLSAEGASVRSLAGQASFQLKPLAEADAWLVLPEEGELVQADSRVEVYPLLPSTAAWGAAGAGRPAGERAGRRR